MKKMQKAIFTKEGFEKIKQEYATLQEKRKGAVLEVQRGRELGDLSENGLYKAAKQELRSIEGRLMRLLYLIKTSQVVESQHTGVIEIGSTVLVEEAGEKKEFHIVGDFEADPKVGKISQKSPIGRALLSRRVGDRVRVYTPRGVLNFHITSIK